MEIDNDSISDVSTTSMRTQAPKRTHTPKRRPLSTWIFMGRELPRSEIVFFSQMSIIVCVVVAAIYNLTTSHEGRSLWITLLSSSLGYILPNPSIERRQPAEKL